MSRLLNAVFVAVVTSAWLGGSGCSTGAGGDSDLQKEVTDLQRRTIPPDSTLIGQHSPALQGWIARADWEFQSTYTGDTYNRWVADKLRPDFQIDGRAGSDARFIRYAHGDVETLMVKAAASGGKLRVSIMLEVYPD